MRALITIAVSLLCFGCFALDEIDAGQKEMDRYGAKGKSGSEAPAAEKAEAATPEQQKQHWWSSARTFSPREDDSKSDVVQCKVAGKTRFMSLGDCQNSGGRVAGG